MDIFDSCHLERMVQQDANSGTNSEEGGDLVLESSPSLSPTPQKRKAKGSATSVKNKKAGFRLPPGDSEGWR
jgi:hypothetical protein